MSVTSNTQHISSGVSAVSDGVINGGVLLFDFGDTTINGSISSTGFGAGTSSSFDQSKTVSKEAKSGVLRSGRTTGASPDLQKQVPPKRRPRAAPSLPAARTSPFPAVLDQQMQMVFNALSVTGIAIALLDDSSDVIAANQQFTALLPCVACKGSGRRRLADRVANRLIVEAARGGTPAAQDASPRAIPLRGDDDRLMAVGHVIPIDSVKNGPMANVRVILIANRAGPREAPSPLLLQRLFGLSPAEARVACGIVEGQTLAAMADAFGVSRETVRSQLKRVLAKSGADRQVELAVLLGGLQV